MIAITNATMNVLVDVVMYIANSSSYLSLTAQMKL